MTIYKIDDRTGIRTYTGRDLDRLRTVYHPAAEPEDKRLPHGEWYCPNPDCVVREVQVTSKLLDMGDVVPRMRCPGCGSKLKFHHWLHSETLLRCKP